MMYRVIIMIFALLLYFPIIGSAAPVGNGPPPSRSQVDCRAGTAVFPIESTNPSRCGYCARSRGCSVAPSGH